MKLWVAALFLIISTCVSAQQTGKVNMHQPSGLESLVEKHIAVNKKMEGIPGFRIQIFSDSGNNSKRRALQAKAKFRKSFSDIEAYIVFQAPYYKVEVGNFISQLEAERVLNKLKEFYPGAFIVAEPEMEIPEV